MEDKTGRKQYNLEQDRCTQLLKIVESQDSAGVTQLVECHLAKVDVESSNLFSRSKCRTPRKRSFVVLPFKFSMIERGVVVDLSALTKNELFLWIDRALEQLLPTNTVAFHFNLYEGSDSVHVQLMGTDSFDDAGVDYWPGDETFSTGEDVFEVPFKVAGANWEEWLETLKSLINDYIAAGNKSAILRGRRGIGIGFVNGDMYILWQANT